MKAERQQKESQKADTIQSKPEKAKLSFVDNRPQVVVQTKLINTILMKNKKAIQLAINTIYGKFTPDKYEYDKSQKKLISEIRFTPNENVEATKIGFVQTIKSRKGGLQAVKEPVMNDRLTENGVNVDRLADNNNPIYGGKLLSPSSKISETELGNKWCELGYRKYKDGTWDIKDAKLYDEPTVGNLGKNGCKDFETSALVIEGVDSGVYLGSVRWGIESNDKGECTKMSFVKKSDGIPTSSFMNAVDKWNISKVRGTLIVKNDNTKVYGDSIILNKDDELIWKDNVGKEGENYVKAEIIKIKSGAHIGKVVVIKVDDLKDKGDGGEHKKLPDIGITKLIQERKEIKMQLNDIEKDGIDEYNIDYYKGAKIRLDKLDELINNKDQF